ncbi:hypothetical protein MLD38_000212 [Melastoma candidum]|uniref:Uncharacterized protein n=1 Tax=Melastoma candidum TaxID=119954 RepID=A0ACB9S8Y2_9MYRT|nr:hypothetical protein MLD38_000212 [Melastoma candidum]
MELSDGGGVAWGANTGMALTRGPEDKLVSWRESGLGVWDKSWGWGDDAIVPGDEIAKRIQDVLKNNRLELQVQATRIKESVS